MRHLTLAPAARPAVALVAALILCPASGCEKSPTCDSAVGHFYDMYRQIYDADNNRLELEEAVALCEDLGAQAAAAGCEAEHARWLRCLAAADEAQPCGPRSLCGHAHIATEACVAGIPYEYACDDGVDGDGDGQTDCFDPDCLNSLDCFAGNWGVFVPQSADRAVDILYVVDDSGSMAGEQANLRANFAATMTLLKDMPGGLPDVHIGVTSTNLGAGGYDILYCDAGGDGGALLTGSCTNPQGAPYIVDVAPLGCEIHRENDNTCTSHDCAPAHCAHEVSATLVEDSATGCPRCRNYSGESLEDVFSCLANLGTGGCGFEQPLEAMVMALDPDRADNAGFVREEATLAVLILTDEDDCSVRDPVLFDGTETGLTSPMGPLTSFRCVEFGITCDINDRTQEGPRQSCIPREDDEALLHPVSRYVDRLTELKDPAMVVVSAIAGPVPPSSAGVGYNLSVSFDASGLPAVDYSCTTDMDGGVPGIRLFELVSSFHDMQLAPWAYSSICSADYTPALAGIGDKITDLLEHQCLPAGPAGCADVAVEFGLPGDGRPCNDVCVAQCAVTETRERGTPTENMAWIPACLEVCPDGYCEGNTDRALAYAAAHPEDRDPLLPVEACWHFRYNEQCWSSRFAEVRIARRADPPPRTFARVSCNQLPADEEICNDGVDNDEDCLVDLDDPCCQNPSNCIN